MRNFITDKLDSISMDIKTYVNILYSIEREKLLDQIMDKDELDELLRIRLLIKELSLKLKNK